MRKKKNWWSVGFLAGIWALLAWGPAAAAQKIAVTTYHYDNLRTGWNSNEKALTPKSVGPGIVVPNRFGRIARIPVDDTVYAQPLVVPDVTIASGVFAGKHDVVYVVTESNSVYAIDANTGQVLLHRNLGAAVSPPNGPYRYECWNNGPHIGIESTPVIDPASQAMFLISYVMRSDGLPAYEVHRIDLTTLADQVPPTLVATTHTLMDGSTLTFSAAEQRQRAALLLEDGNIYAAFASWCDRNPARGWLLGWQGSNLQPLANNILTNKLPASSSNKLSSIWMSGYGVSAIAGHLYFATGNSPDHEYEATANLSESVVKVSAGLGHVLDFFTPSSVGSLDTGDVDLGSGGVLILPDQPGNVPHMAAAAGKDGMLYLLNRVDLGGFSLVANHVLGQYFIGTCFCGQSYYLNKIVSSGGDQIGVWRVDTSPSPGLTKIQSSVPLGISGEGGFFTAISSNGPDNAIIWAVSNTHNDAPAPLPSSPPCASPFQQTNVPCLFAFQPIDGNPQLRLLFSGAAGNWQVPRPADAVDATNSNTVPVVANGHVYVTSYRELDIFGFGQPVFEPTTAFAPTAQPEAVTTQLQKSKLGIITKVDGSRFTLKTAAGVEIQIDARDALKEGIAPELAAGQAVSVYGTVDASGVMHAEVIKHAHVQKKP